jgi:hypothetical protein
MVSRPGPPFDGLPERRDGRYTQYVCAQIGVWRRLKEFGVFRVLAVLAVCCVVAIYRSL